MKGIKRVFQIYAGVGSIFASLVGIGFPIYWFVRTGYHTISPIDVAFGMCIAVSIALLVVSIMVFSKTSLNAYMHLTVAGLTLSAIICLLIAVGRSLFSLIPIIPVILYVVSLCIANPNKTKDETDKVVNAENKTQNTAVNSENANVQSGNQSITEKIEQIKLLNKQGIISSAEMKALIIETLKKN